MNKKYSTLTFLLGLSIAITSCEKTQSITESGEQAKPFVTVNSANLSALVVTNKTYFVSASTGNDGWDGLSSTYSSGIHGPFRTINQANAKTGEGDVVNIMPGNYYWANSDQVAKIDHSGSAGHPNTYQAFDVNNRPKIYVRATDNPAADGIYKAVEIDADYITVKNLELIGDSVNCSTTSPQGDGKYNTNGIQIAGIGTARHDIEIDNCIIHAFPGAGIAASQCDNITITGNIVYHNAFYSEHGTSGITVVDPENIAADGDSTHPKIIIQNNLCYNNKETVVNITTSPLKITDGNGIIVDVNYTSVDPYPAYRGYTSVRNNISYCNGGAGINVTRAQNVSVVNNTTCDNGQILSYGEINFDNNCNNVIVSNNIFYARATSLGGKAYNSFTGTGISFNYNLYYPYGTATKGANDVTSNPLFAQISGYNIPTNFDDTAPAAYFKLMSTSPAVNTGTNQSSAYYAYYDFANTYRATYGLPDRGAYEYH